MPKIEELLLERELKKTIGAGEHFKFPVSPQPIEQGQIAPEDPGGALRWMNSRHFVVSEAGKTVVVKEEIDPVLKRRVLRRSGFTGHKTRSVFDRYNIVAEDDLQAGVDQLAAYVDQQPADAKVVALKKTAS